MPRFLAILLLFSAVLALPAALPNSVVVNTTIKPATDGERFLFLVDTSSSMERIQPEVEATVYELIRSGIGGYMRAGDTYGMWTFNKHAYPGRFAMQVWDPRKVSPLGTIAAAFLSEQTYENSSNLKQLIASLGPVVRSVSNLNVMIISDGASLMRGTPFDEAINTDYKKKNRERKDLKRPFVTTLVVRGGWFVDNSVRIAGQQIPLPERPLPETVAAPTNLPPVAKVPPAGNGKVVEHTVIVDAIPKPKSAQTSAVPNLVATTPSQIQPAPDPAKASDGDKEASAAASAGNSASTAPSSLVEAPRPKVMQITTKPSSLPTNPPDFPQPVAAPVPSESVLTSSTSVTNVVTPASSVAPPSPSPEPNPPARQDISAAAPGQPDSSLADSAFAALTASPITVAARELNPGPASSQAAPPAMQAMTAPTQNGLSAGFMLAFGGVLLAAALFLLLMTVRRFRPVPQGSLITQSMDTQTLQRR